MMKTKYGQDWLKVQFIGVNSTVESLRNIAKYFDDPDLTARTEAVIAEELEEVLPEMEYYRKICQGKTAALYVGGSRAHHYQHLLADIGIETVLAGYEFAHRDDYEGREVLPSIKEDGDSKNIENLTVEPEAGKYRVFLSKERYENLKDQIPLNYYAGMIRDMKDGSIIVDDLTITRQKNL
jgi:nitrogenase molybdenum-iron protein alpha chain